MNALRASFRLVVALLAMAAVLIGAMEHESLLLQPEQASVELQPDTEQGSLANRASDTGTESAFRAERSPVAKAPSVAVASVTFTTVSTSHATKGERLFRVRSNPSPHRQGVVALRL